MSQFVITKDKKGEFRWAFKADNGETIADSAEGYKEKRDCTHGIEVLKQEIAGAKIQDETAA